MASVHKNYFCISESDILRIGRNVDLSPNRTETPMLGGHQPRSGGLFCLFFVFSFPFSVVIYFCCMFISKKLTSILLLSDLYVLHLLSCA